MILYYTLYDLILRNFGTQLSKLRAQGRAHAEEVEKLQPDARLFVLPSVSLKGCIRVSIGFLSGELYGGVGVQVEDAASRAGAVSSQGIGVRSQENTCSKLVLPAAWLGEFLGACSETPLL